MGLFSTDRLIIRRFKEGDAINLFDYFEKPRVNCFIDEKLDSLEAAKAEVLKRSKDVSQYAVCLPNDMLIGNMFAYPEHEGDSYNVGWNLNPKYEGKGFAREAATGLLEYLFNKQNARRIYCYVEDDNIRSQALCKRLGMRQEGTFIAFVSFVNNADGSPKYENTMQFAILKWNGNSYKMWVLTFSFIE